MDGWKQSLSPTPHSACALWRRARHACEDLFLLTSNGFCRHGGNTCGLGILEAGKKRKKENIYEFYYAFQPLYRSTGSLHFLQNVKGHSLFQRSNCVLSFPANWLLRAMGSICAVPHRKSWYQWSDWLVNPYKRIPDFITTLLCFLSSKGSKPHLTMQKYN